MKKTFLMSFALGVLFLSSCTSVNRTMREPMTRLELQREDFVLSAQETATATSTKIFGIDFERLFSKNMGAVDKDQTSISFGAGSSFVIPVIGSYISDFTANYALYKLMDENRGYDVVLYPQYTTTVNRPIGLGLYTITTVEVTARLGKLKD